MAEAFGIGAETVKTMLQRSNGVMREALERAGYTPAMRRAIAAGKGREKRR
ncbi:hypothetical protein D3C83_309890 [compost metagenome]